MADDYSIINVENIQENGDVSIVNTEFKLKPYDYISVRPDPFFTMQRKVTITGGVYYPGVYTLLNPYENITDILKRAGGLQPKAYPIASTLTRKGQIIRINLQDILDKPDSKKNIVMHTGDEIFVALKLDLTQILGEVSAPGNYKFMNGMRVNDYIAMAGGFSMDAEKNDVWITFPDGQSRHYKRWLSNPTVLDGSVITVGREEEIEPIDPTEFAKEIASIMADLAQVVVLIIIAGG
jgi:protein involved in polysaccharide export with SLBB domain